MSQLFSSVNTDHLAASTPEKWTIEDSEQTYQIEGWGDPYFSINRAGHITVSPQGDRGTSLDLYELVEALRKRNIGLPVLIRFPEILADRIERLYACFDRAISRYNYPGTYRGVFPIKCNQHRHLVEALVKHGKPHQLGLEVGSKPELMIALASLNPIQISKQEEEESLLICNGYKDREYIETALLSRRLGYQTILVVEQLEELQIIQEISSELGIKPVIGVRAKLSTKGTGRWGTSTGDRAKFGLTIWQILQAVETLKSYHQLDSLQLLHFHIGSQVSSISVIKEAIREAAQIYVELTAIGSNLNYLDVGGGLAVDYDGSKTNKNNASKNYNMQNYANDIVAEIKEACDQAEINVPTIVSESGRAIASHQGVLIFDVLGSNEPPLTPPPVIEAEEHLIIRNLWETYALINENNYQEPYHDAIQFKQEAISLFNFSYLSLQERARAEQLYWACCAKLFEIIKHQENINDELKEIANILTSIYYINLSVFQSAPDHWAIEQLFPIMPIHRLNEQPSKRGILADLTCDSDGKISQFINPKGQQPKDFLELHPLEKKQPYYLGMFLVGAYQEIMGNLHNLFGDTNVVHIQTHPKGYQIEQFVRGDTITEVLAQTQYSAEELLENLRRHTEQALERKLISLPESRRLLQNYERSLSNYTYLNQEP
ncbi:biosynthetic arginine decarboxylase [Dactylococcopsis salina]|uniref:Biosynthetic arginine decarboxylase n=1 Tax=Dactylococcopsis salina (strain PCC 8305) TaxID=13035 RepID=U3GK27_DACS8|nr:biosynthetic arginine decarboxylase [Dactylococcopsis salina]AFZ52083.1 arginine decarboxylase, biosynthetic [Dactylococcopsis salina PCC 8305]